jgi:FkbM family methyltransferase
MTAPLIPVTVEQPPAVDWGREPARRLRFAAWLARHAPRGRGALPRMIGRHAGRGLRTSVSTARGAMLAVDPAHLDVYTTMLLNGGRWDDHVLESSVRLLRPGEVFWDIGANAGYMSISVAHRFRADGVQVMAFEPQLSLARAIVRSAALNGLDGVRVFDCLLGDVEGTVDLFVPAHGIHASTVARARGAIRLACRQTTVDAQVESGAVPAPHVIKVDVEGAEFAVFRGAERTIQRFAPALIFESDENMHRFGYHRDDLIAYLGGLTDYTFCAIMDRGLVELAEAGGSFAFPDIVALPSRLRDVLADAAHAS